MGELRIAEDRFELETRGWGNRALQRTGLNWKPEGGRVAHRKGQV